MKFAQGNPNSVLLQENLCTYVIQKPKDNLTLLDRYYEQLKDFDNCYLMLSGGSDSQFMLRLLKHFNINFTAITYKNLWNSGIVNTDDVIYAQEVAENFNVDLEVVEFDLKKFYDSNLHLKWARDYDIRSPQIAMQLEFIKNQFENNSKLVMGGDMPYLMYGDNIHTANVPDHSELFTGLDYVYMDLPNVLTSSVEPYHRLCEQKNINIIINISYCSPEAVYQILDMQINIVEDKKMHIEYSKSEPQFRELLQFKKTVWNTILPGDIDTLMKVGGFERLKKLLAIKSGVYNKYDKDYRIPMEIQYPKRTLRYRFKHKFCKDTLQIPQRFQSAIENSNSICVNGYHFDF